MTFTGSREPLFFNLRDIYRISTAPLFQFMWYLQDLGSLPLLVYAVFTGSRQPPFLIYMIFTGLESPSFLIYMIFTGNRQPPFFTIYMIFAGYQQPPFSIYMVFTGSRQPPFFNLRGIYNVIYRILAATLFQFTWYLHDMCSFTLQYLQYLSFDLHVSTPKFT